MSERTPLSPSSREFARLEYFLQLSLKSTTARIIQAHLLSNPHQQVNFDRQSHDLLTLESWLDCSQFSSAAHEEEVYQKVSAGGVQFHVGGRILVEQLGSNKLCASTMSSKAIKDHASSKIVKQLMLCRIAVGRAFACKDVTEAVKDAIPNGYNSFQIASNNHKDTSYGHSYLLKNAQQVLATHFVTFEYDPVAERRSREKPRCDNCENTYATVYCSADNANLCSECDTRLHMANKVSQKHIRTSIGKGVDALGQCRTHSDQRIEFFCSQCHVPVCVHCKMVGHHSTGESARHKLVSVVEAFDSVMKESQVTDLVLASRRTAIQHQNTAISKRATQIEQKQTQLESDLEQIYIRALADLKQQTEQKLLVLEGDQMELSRQDQEITVLEQFLEYQQTGIDAYPLLFNWSKHLELRQSLHEFNHFRDNIDVFPDLKIAGDLKIDVDPAAAPSPTKFMSSYRKSSPEKKPLMEVKRTPATARRTSDFFSETLSALDDIDLERPSTVGRNRLMDDERSLATGYDDC